MLDTSLNNTLAWYFIYSTSKIYQSFPHIQTHIHIYRRLRAHIYTHTYSGIYVDIHIIPMSAYTHTKCINLHTHMQYIHNHNYT